MKIYRQTADSSGFYRERTGDFGRWAPTSAQGAADAMKDTAQPLATVVGFIQPVPAQEVVAATVYSPQPMVLG